MAHERICVVCGAQHRYCKNCAEFDHLPTWHYAYCSEPCKETYMILNKYDYKHISAEEAKAELDALGVKIKNPEMLKSVDAIKKELKAQKKKEKKYKEWIPENKEEETIETNDDTIEDSVFVESEYKETNHDEHIVNLID